MSCHLSESHCLHPQNYDNEVVKYHEPFWLWHLMDKKGQTSPLLHAVFFEILNYVFFHISFPPFLFKSRSKRGLYQGWEPEMMRSFVEEDWPRIRCPHQTPWDLGPAPIWQNVHAALCKWRGRKNPRTDCVCPCAMIQKWKQILIEEHEITAKILHPLLRLFKTSSLTSLSAGYFSDL